MVIISLRVSEAAERKNQLMRGRSEKLQQKFAMSKEMLDRLEAEKQSLLTEKLNDKERRTQNKKERLRRRRETKVRNRDRRIQRTKERALEKSAMASEVFESKMRTVEEKKMQLKEKKDRKHDAHRYKQLQARLKTLENVNENDKQKEFKVWLHLLNKETREQKHKELARLKDVRCHL